MQATASTDILIGPWGGEGGDTPWIFKPDTRIASILVRHGDAVDSISFTYKDNEDFEDLSELYGGDGGLLEGVSFNYICYVYICIIYILILSYNI